MSNYQTNHQITPKLVDIEMTLVNTVTDQFAEATEACDRALNVSADADRLSKTADRLSDEARIAEADAENVRAEAHSAEIDATVHLSRLIVSAIKNATPSHLSNHYLGLVIERITAAVNQTNDGNPPHPSNRNRWIERIINQIEDFNFNPNA